LNEDRRKVRTDGKTRKQLLGELKEKRGYWKLKKAVLDLTV
jgi:hypothetical protein